MTVVRDTLAEIAEMDYISQVLIVDQDGRWLGGSPEEEQATLGASFVYGLGTFSRLSEAANMGDFKHALIVLSDGIIFLASLGTGRVLGIVAKPEVNRGLVLSRLPFWADHLREALG
ncbi:MAG: roadblock/LC7 domain-containing protein [Myxococcales bacterium]|nr:roadblock/LC7 domain-containing protein [Myxococcales bacterium]MCB9644355.1 roadblock/LC7 domain-containing protein [Myxococcales bacterium]